MDSDSLPADYGSEDRSPKGGDFENDRRSLASNDSQAENLNQAPPSPRIRQRIPPAPDASQVNTLYTELSIVVAAHNKFEHFDLNRVWDASVLLVRYGIPSLESFRTTDDQARKYFLEDLRKAEKLSFAEMSLILKLNRHIPPHDQKTSEKNIRFTELDIPRALSSFKPDLSTLTQKHIISHGPEMNH